MKLPYEARIEVAYEADGELARAIEEHREWITRETLAVNLAPGAPSGTVHDFDIEGMKLRTSIRHVSR
jgi:isoleucyl-tRNA synthetase